MRAIPKTAVRGPADSTHETSGLKDKRFSPTLSATNEAGVGACYAERQFMRRAIACRTSIGEWPGYYAAARGVHFCISGLARFWQTIQRHVLRTENQSAACHAD